MAEFTEQTLLNQAIRNRPLYGSSIARFVILEYDYSLGGDQPKGDDWSIEHIMPRAYCDTWASAISQAAHTKLRDVWANLVPLSKAMNSDVAQKEFNEKRKRFAKDSMFASARAIGSKFSTWDESVIQSRSEVLADWAVTRWPRPTS